jgi:hypothetical protein
LVVLNRRTAVSGNRAANTAGFEFSGGFTLSSFVINFAAIFGATVESQKNLPRPSSSNDRVKSSGDKVEHRWLDRTSRFF